MAPLGSIDIVNDRLVRRMIRATAAAGNRSPSAGGGFPREVRHAAGRTWLRQAARRPHAARTSAELDTLLALGVQPVSMGAAAAAPVEPDLAVVSSAVAAAMPEELLAHERAGVPVVVLPAADVGEQLRIVGEATGLVGRATGLADDVEQAARRAAAPVRRHRVGAFTVDGSGRPHLLTAAAPLAALLGRFGLDRPVTAGTPGSELVPVDVAARRALEAADVLLGLELYPGQLSAVEHDPWLTRLPAVRAGGYRRLAPPAAQGVAAPSVRTLPTAVTALAEALA